jgi:putative sugar O-methyltransferase
MLLLVQKILYALKYNNFFFRASIFFFSHCQKIIFLPFIYIANKKNFAKLDYLSGFKEKNSLNLINKPFLKKTIKFYHDNLKKNKAIHGIWEENLQLKFYEFRKALLNKNILKLNYIFNNMFRLPITEGLCVGYEHFRNSKNLFGKIYIKTLFNNYLLELNKKININMLRFENIGNPSGVKFKKNILSIETLRHANQALTMTELTSNIKRPKILEIGGGLGGNCYQYMYSFNKNKKIDYYLVDILEVLLMAGFFLQKSRGLVFLNSLPKKKLTKKNIFLVPKDNLNLLNNIKFDLVFNSCSLSEMDIKDCYKYEKFINDSTKKNSIFYHINHDLKISYTNKNNFSTNKVGSEIMSEFNKFKLIKKYKRRNNLPEDKLFKYNEFIYKKILN